MPCPPHRALLLVAMLAASVAVPGSVAGAVDHAGSTTDESGAAAATAGVTMITDCTLITEPGHYRLANDILDSDANRCINIQASDVHFDGAGHTIDGVGKYLFDDNGVSVSTKAVLAKDGPNTNVTVTNVVATDFGYGLWYGETSDGRIVNNTFRDNGIYGLYVGYGANDNLIANNVIRDIRIDDPDQHGAGIVVANHAHGNVIEANDVRSIERFGIEVAASNHTTIRDNTVADTGGHGITVANEGNVIRGNTVSQSGEAGINARLSPAVEIVDNTVEDSRDGIALAFSDGAVVRDNVIRGHDRYGIQFHGGIAEPWGDHASPGSTIAGNTVVDNGRVGIFLPLNNNDTVVRDNVIARNGEVGIRLERNAGNRLVNNTLTDHRIAVLLAEAGGTVLERNAYDEYAEWAVLSRRDSQPIRVDSATFDGDQPVSFAARSVAVARASALPDGLPEGTRPVGQFLKVWPEGDRAWLEVTLPFDEAAVGPDGSVDVWVHDGSWRRASAVDERPTDRRANLSIAGATVFGLAVSVEPTPTASPTSAPSPTAAEAASPTPTPGQPGFGFVAALLALVGGGLLARRRRG